MNTNYLVNLNTEMVITKEDIILALTEGEVDGWKKSMRKIDLMNVLVNAIDIAVSAEAVDAMINKEETTMETTVNVIDANKAHVEAEAHITSLATEEAEIKGNILTTNHCAKETAEAFYRIKEMKLYEELKDSNGEACKSFKSYINDFRNGEVYGVKYAMAMHYVNLCKYVYPHREAFTWYGTHLLVNLIKPLKNEETRGIILEAVDNGILSDNMTSKEFKEALEALLRNTEAEAVTEETSEAEAEASSEYSDSNTCEVSDEAIDKAVDMMEAFLEANAHDAEVTHAWHIILKALDR